MAYCVLRNALLTLAARPETVSGKRSPSLHALDDGTDLGGKWLNRGTAEENLRSADLGSSANIPSPSSRSRSFGKHPEHLFKPTIYKKKASVLDLVRDKEHDTKPNVMAVKAQDKGQGWIDSTHLRLTERPPSPYIDAELSEDLCQFREFAEANGPDIMTAEMQRIPQMTEIPAEQTTAILRQVISRCITLLFERWPARRPSNQNESSGSPSSGRETTPNSSVDGGNEVPIPDRDYDDDHAVLPDPGVPDDPTEGQDLIVP
ncbi:hypothetical protein C8A00DRAFT_38347 [Chaetomidium leptoderma]|uniref:Uncharacterized protein n=1 Tax=Chaetomidium leptoderma TaxID=669021 RepID=A0AAN6VDU9_9PEZI|nr:hypothetical protein C8A00DRAFT_38347 [Chaetomidium leptoderma]